MRTSATPGTAAAGAMAAAANWWTRAHARARRVRGGVVVRVLCCRARIGAAWQKPDGFRKVTPVRREGVTRSMNESRFASPAPDAAPVVPAPSAALTDTHVHLNSSQFAADLEPVLERARAAGVQRFLCPGYDLESSRAAVAIAARHPDVVAAVGVHPHDARTWDDAFEAGTDAWLAHGAAVAAGEMGLDYYYDHSPRDVQRAVLVRQLRLARRHGVPVVVHNRDSDADMAAILADEAAGLRVVLHAFTGAKVL